MASHDPGGRGQPKCLGLLLCQLIRWGRVYCDGSARSSDAGVPVFETRHSRQRVSHSGSSRPGFGFHNGPGPITANGALECAYATAHSSIKKARRYSKISAAMACNVAPVSVPVNSEITP